MGDDNNSAAWDISFELITTACLNEKIGSNNVNF